MSLLGGAGFSVLSWLTTGQGVVIVDNMKAKSLLKARVPLGDDRFMDTVIWQVPAPLPGSPHLSVGVRGGGAMCAAL